MGLTVFTAAETVEVLLLLDRAGLAVTIVEPLLAVGLVETNFIASELVDVFLELLAVEMFWLRVTISCFDGVEELDLTADLAVDFTVCASG